ncbi:MAG: ligase-associated DNA damage response endonuclease PdeM [Comamonadaceae bacterium]|nr:ligase-associated DNA damage response endonuclease PdeM [Comamonadaceae bacterium]
MDLQLALFDSAPADRAARLPRGGGDEHRDRRRRARDPRPGRCLARGRRGRACSQRLAAMSESRHAGERWIAARVIDGRHPAMLAAIERYARQRPAARGGGGHAALLRPIRPARRPARARLPDHERCPDERAAAPCAAPTAHRREMLADRALLLPQARALVVADVHFGKAATFRARGVPVPQGTTTDNLRRLDALLAATGAGLLVFLGDLFHAREAHAPDTLAALRALARAPSAASTWCWSKAITTATPARRRPISACAWCRSPGRSARWPLCHHPQRVAGAHVLAGHLHPCVRLYGGAYDSLRLPCFWMREELTLLPAFGAFTGGAPIVREAGDRAVALAEGRLFPLPAPARRARRVDRAGVGMSIRGASAPAARPFDVRARGARRCGGGVRVPAPLDHRAVRRRSPQRCGDAERVAREQDRRERRAVDRHGAAPRRRGHAGRRRWSGLDCGTSSTRASALLYVDPAARFGGVSDALLRGLEDAARGEGLTRLLLTSTLTAQRFYRARGYLPDGDPRRGPAASRPSQPVAKRLDA